MKNSLFIVTAVLLFSIGASAQTGQLLQSTKDIFNYSGATGATNPINLGNTFQTIYGKPLPPAEVIGDNFLDTTFAKGRLVLFKDSTVYGGIPSRLDLKNDLIEIQTDQGLRVLDGFRIKLFVLDYPNGSSRLLVNTKNFKFEEQAPNGFLEILTSGIMTFGVYNRIWVRQPTYNASLGSGDPNIKIMKEKDYYYIKGNQAVKFSSSKKTLLGIFENKKPEMTSFFAENDLNFKNPADIAKAFAYYNTLK